MNKQIKKLIVKLYTGQALTADEDQFCMELKEELSG
jgi:hypothetical protein